MLFKKKTDKAKTQTGKTAVKSTKTQTGKTVVKGTKAQTGKTVVKGTKTQTGKTAAKGTETQAGKTAVKSTKTQAGKTAAKGAKTQTVKKTAPKSGQAQDQSDKVLAKLMQIEKETRLEQARDNVDGLEDEKIAENIELLLKIMRSEK